MPSLDFARLLGLVQRFVCQLKGAQVVFNVTQKTSYSLL
jgi:hypothetical protein